MSFSNPELLREAEDFARFVRDVCNGGVGMREAAAQLEVSQATQRAAALRREAVKRQGPEHKIAFDLDQFNDLGLVGPPLRAVRYEFCIPEGERFAEEVRSIDPSVEIQGASPGTSGCEAGESRALGSTHQPAFRRVLLGLASLPYVEAIRKASAN